jgi:dihydroorotate dehydrogenase
MREPSACFATSWCAKKSRRDLPGGLRPARYHRGVPDWSYRTVLRPLLLSLGAERARRLATGTLQTLTRLPFGRGAIDFLGHMRADPRLRTPFGSTDLAGPIALGALVDPAGDAVAAFERFGVGLIEVGPVALEGNRATPQWRVDLPSRSIADLSGGVTVGIDEVARNLSHARPTAPICVRIAESDGAAVRRIVERLEEHVALFAVEARSGESAARMIAAAGGRRPVLLSVGGDATDLALSAMRAGAAGVWFRGAPDEHVRSVRAAFPDALIVAGDVTEPADAQRLLHAGANVAAIESGLVCSGPGLAKRCNEALLAAAAPETPLERFGLDAARSAWFWAFLLGVAMFAGGVLAIAIASTRIVLPYDERMAGLTRAQVAALNPRVLSFMAHDRVSLAGTMISVGIFYAALAWFGIRRGEHWAHVTVIVSAMVGFFSFFFFLGFGYFDPFHAFVTAILTQFTLLCMVMPLSPRQPPVAEWHESPAWRRGQWGQLLFILIGMVLTGAGTVISLIGCTSVFVETDLEFLRTTPDRLRASFEHLIPLIAHDRASLGGMLIANGVTVWLAAQWGFRRGARWLWTALAWGGNIAFAAATAVHVVVGYGAVLHLTPAGLGWLAWNVALALTHAWLTPRACTSPSSAPRG